MIMYMGKYVILHDMKNKGKFLDVIQTLFHNIFRISQYCIEGVQSLGPKIETGVSSLSQGVIGINDSKDQSDQPVQSTLL